MNETEKPTMTRKEAEQLYGEVKCFFSSYYKYSFQFKGKADDGAIVEMAYGGNNDDIYRYNVSPDKPEFIGNGYYIRITKDDKIICDIYDY